jgi:hypothetical protein
MKKELIAAIGFGVFSLVAPVNKVDNISRLQRVDTALSQVDRGYYGSGCQSLCSILREMVQNPGKKIDWEIGSTVKMLDEIYYERLEKQMIEKVNDSKALDALVRQTVGFNRLREDILKPVKQRLKEDGYYVEWTEMQEAYELLYFSLADALTTEPTHGSASYKMVHQQLKSSLKEGLKNFGKAQSVIGVLGLLQFYPKPSPDWKVEYLSSVAGACVGYTKNQMAAISKSRDRESIALFRSEFNHFASAVAKTFKFVRDKETEAAVDSFGTYFTSVKNYLKQLEEKPGKPLRVPELDI